MPKWGNHLDPHATWGKVGVEIWTHKIGRSTDRDVIFAGKYGVHASDHLRRMNRNELRIE
jgi:pterin-4a-carbinolamine dehydratase